MGFFTFTDAEDTEDKVEYHPSMKRNDIESNVRDIFKRVDANKDAAPA